MSQHTSFYLKIQRFEQICSFELTWGKGQCLNATIKYPQQLIKLYQEWQKIYLNFYRNALRGKVAEVGTIAPLSNDWHHKLVQAEAQLLWEFYQWLRSAELYEIRAAIARGHGSNQEQTTIDVFLACYGSDLARLPWEVWEIGGDLGLSVGKIRIVRQPQNIHEPPENQRRKSFGKARILAIFGDDTGLTFHTGIQALQSLNKVAATHIIGWEAGKNINKLKTEIIKAITDERGWDILFFAGHSNETNLTGGEIGIAPHTAISISELEQPLKFAKQHGLQFAFFNSCEGLSIANRLIDWGLSQVAVMREPIHNRVAEEFFVKFVQAIAEYKDVHEALLEASQYLKSEKNLTYPSSYLIPTLFRHPAAPVFRLEPFGIKKRLQQLIPSRWEATIISASTLISVLLPVQHFLLERRVLVQAIYRDMTGQVAPNVTPPVTLVEIDEESIAKAKIDDPKPIDRKYLARLVDKLAASQAKVVGIDYVLNRYQQESDRILSKSLQAAVQLNQKPTWFVFAIDRDEKTKKWLHVASSITSPNWSLQGHIDIYSEQGYMQTFPLAPEDNEPNVTKISRRGDAVIWGRGENSSKISPRHRVSLSPRQPQPLISVSFDDEPLFFAGLLTLSHQLQRLSDVPQPQLHSQKDFLQQILDDLKTNNAPKTTLTSDKFRQQPLTVFSYWLKQFWLQPIVDFSIPPQQIYRSIPAWKFLEHPTDPDTFAQQIVIIAPGGYGEAGTDKDGEDNFNVPLALDYWRSLEKSHSTILTGGEYHAYMVHHLLNERLIVPIPDLWIVGIAILLGKILYLLQLQYPQPRWRWILLTSFITGSYGLASLQLYISSTGLLLPWILPSLTLWIYILPNILKRKSR
jgi:CHASE2 domain-containing sensor protein